MSKHQFDTDIAKEYGIEAAIILDNIAFWIEKNRANEKHFHDGAYWTYNSIKAFNELFPYMSESTIRRVLKTLEEKGLIGTGNYNKAGYDRTLWYSITTKGFNILNKSICHFEQMEVSESANGFSQSSEPIPDIKPVKKHIKKHEKKDKGEYKPYGKNNKVFFYDEEYEQLVKEHGEDKIYTAIDIVDDYLIKNPAKTYTNFVRVFSAWALDEADRRLKQSFFRTSSIPKTSTAPAPDIVCCGEHYDWDIGFCKQCGKKYNREGKVI